MFVKSQANDKNLMPHDRYRSDVDAEACVMEAERRRRAIQVHAKSWSVWTF